MPLEDLSSAINARQCDLSIGTAPSPIDSNLQATVSAAPAVTSVTLRLHEQAAGRLRERVLFDAGDVPGDHPLFRAASRQQLNDWLRELNSRLACYTSNNKATGATMLLVNIHFWLIIGIGINRHWDKNDQGFVIGIAWGSVGILLSICAMLYCMFDVTNPPMYNAAFNDLPNIIERRIHGTSRPLGIVFRYDGDTSSLPQEASKMFNVTKAIAAIRVIVDVTSMPGSGQGGTFAGAQPGVSVFRGVVDCSADPCNRRELRELSDESTTDRPSLQDYPVLAAQLERADTWEEVDEMLRLLELMYSYDVPAVGLSYAEQRKQLLRIGMNVRARVGVAVWTNDIDAACFRILTSLHRLIRWEAGHSQTHPDAVTIPVSPALGCGEDPTDTGLAPATVDAGLQQLSTAENTYDVFTALSALRFALMSSGISSDDARARARDAIVPVALATRTRVGVSVWTPVVASEFCAVLGLLPVRPVATV